MSGVKHLFLWMCIMWLIPIKPNISYCGLTTNLLYNKLLAPNKSVSLEPRFAKTLMIEFYHNIRYDQGLSSVGGDQVDTVLEAELRYFPVFTVFF